MGTSSGSGVAVGQGVDVGSSVAISTPVGKGVGVPVVAANAVASSARNAAVASLPGVGVQVTTIGSGVKVAVIMLRG